MICPCCITFIPACTAGCWISLVTSRSARLPHDVADTIPGRLSLILIYCGLNGQAKFCGESLKPCWLHLWLADIRCLVLCPSAANSLSTLGAELVKNLAASRFAPTMLAHMARTVPLGAYSQGAHGSALMPHPVQRSAQQLPGLGSSLRGRHQRPFRHHATMLQAIRNLPIFPLGFVAFPGSEVHTFQLPSRLHVRPACVICLQRHHVGSRSSKDGRAWLHGLRLTKRSMGMPMRYVPRCWLPLSQVPLNIFEARYRVLFSTLLAGGHECVLHRPSQRSCCVASMPTQRYLLHRVHSAMPVYEVLLKS